MMNFTKRKFAKVLAFYMFFTVANINEAYGGAGDQKAVVFLIEHSNSMKQTDKNEILLDDILQFANTLPSNYHIGAVGYNSEIDTIVNIVSANQRINLMNGFSKFKYNGYSNTGLALEQAFTLLKDFYSYDKNIIIVTDGDIALSKNSETTVAKEKFQSVYDELIDDRTKIHRIKIGTANIKEDIVYEAVVNSGGRDYNPSTTAEVYEIFDDILENNFAIRKSTLIETENEEATVNLSCNLPFLNQEKATLVVTSSNEIINSNASTQNTELVQQGKDYAIFNIEDLDTTNVNLQIETKENSQIKVEYIPQYEVKVNVDIEYIDTKPTDKEKKTYDRQAKITLSFIQDDLYSGVVVSNKLNSAVFGSLKSDYEEEVEEVEVIEESEVTEISDESEEVEVTEVAEATEEVEESEETQELEEIQEIQILNEPFFDGKILELTDKLTGEIQYLTLENGTISYIVDVPNYEHKTMALSLSEIPVNILNEIIFNIELEESPKIPNYALITGVAFVCFAVIGIAVSKGINVTKRVQKILEEPAEYEKDGEFTGRLNIYITKSTINSNIPPLTLNLLRIKERENITLQEILDLLNVSEQFIGADKVVFTPSIEEVLVLSNNSKCRISKKDKAIDEKTNTKLSINSDIDISSEDDNMAITVQYKDMTFKEKENMQAESENK